MRNKTDGRGRVEGGALLSWLAAWRLRLVALLSWLAACGALVLACSLELGACGPACPGSGLGARSFLWLAAPGFVLAAPGCVHRFGTRNETESCTHGQAEGQEPVQYGRKTVKYGRFSVIGEHVPGVPTTIYCGSGRLGSQVGSGDFGAWGGTPTGAGVSRRGGEGAGSAGAACAFRRAGVQFRGRVRSGGHGGG